MILETTVLYVRINKQIVWRRRNGVRQMTGVYTNQVTAEFSGVIPPRSAIVCKSGTETLTVHQGGHAGTISYVMLGFVAGGTDGTGCQH